MSDLDFENKCIKQHIIFVLLVLLLRGQSTLSYEKSPLKFEVDDTDEVCDKNIVEALKWQRVGFTETVSSRNDHNDKGNLEKHFRDFNSKMQDGWSNHSMYKCEYGAYETSEMPEKNTLTAGHKVSHDGMLRSVRGVDALLEYQPVSLLTTEDPFQLHYGPELPKTGRGTSFLNITGWDPSKGLVSPVMAGRGEKRYPHAYGRVQHSRRRNILANIKNVFKPKVPLQNGSDYMSFKVPLEQLVNPDDAFIIDRNGVVHKGHMHYRQFVHPVVKVLTRKNQRQSIGGPQLGKPVKRDEPSTTAQPTKSSPEANKPTDATDKSDHSSQEKTKSNETSQDEVKSGVKDGKGSHQYQVMSINSKSAANNETGQSANNATSSEETAKKNMLKQIIAELEKFKTHSVSSNPIVTVDNTPCSIFGSWISDAGGVRFDISFLNVSNALNVSIAPTIPPKKEAWFNETEWNITGEIPFSERGVFTLTAVHKTQRKTALFAGQCMICMGEELVAGTWITGRSARDCRDTIVAYSERPDVFRKEVLHILRAQKKVELASKSNMTTTAMPATESPKKVKRWWGLN